MVVRVGRLEKRSTAAPAGHASGSRLHTTDVHRLWVSLALGGLAASGVWPQLGEVRHLRIEPPPIVWLPEGSFVMGASDAEIAYAVELCMDQRPLPVRSLAPDLDGACTPRRRSAGRPRG